MSVIPDGEKWRCQFYYTDWLGEKHRKNKRGFATRDEATVWEKKFLKKYNVLHYRYI